MSIENLLNHFNGLTTIQLEIEYWKKTIFVLIFRTLGDETTFH